MNFELRGREGGGGTVAVDEGGEGVEGGEGSVYFFVLLAEHDIEMFVEQDGDFENIDGIEAKAFFAEDAGVGGDGVGGLKFEFTGEDGDQLGFGGRHGFPVMKMEGSLLESEMEGHAGGADEAGIDAGFEMGTGERPPLLFL